MLLGFKKQFVTRIEKGSKIHTFRAKRKIKPKIGEQLYLYKGLRTSNCQKIVGDYRLKAIQPVRMVITRTCYASYIQYKIKLHIGRKFSWTQEELHEMAVNDGFNNFIDFCEYWLKDFKPDTNAKGFFSGNCYHWTDFIYE